VAQTLLYHQPTVMQTQLFTFSLFSLVLLFAACNTEGNALHKKRTQIRLLNAESAKVVLCTDTTDLFFEAIQPLEIAIQLKLNDSSSQSLKSAPRDSQLAIYKTFIASDARDFSPEEQKITDKSIQKALQLCYQTFPNLALPDTISLIKAENQHYGPNVYFTRENSIIIPASAITMANQTKLQDVLIHEIFHVFSRYNPTTRKALFAKIGFSPIQKLELSPFLQARQLINPDAVDCRYMISLKQGDTSILAVPIIYSQFANYNDKLTFFSHLIFELFEVKAVAREAGAYRIVSPNVGISPKDLPDFFEQVGRNTSYIIHPEEIIADNFRLLVLGQSAQMPNAELAEALKKIILESTAKQ
jgi:hypothetical protein